MTVPIAGISGVSGLSGMSGVSGAGLSGMGGISPESVTQLAGAQLTDQTGAAGAASAARGADFAGVLSNGIQSLEQLDKTAQVKGVEAATGDLTDVHDYVIAANEMQVATELTTTIRNKALEAFNEIMRMPL